MDWRPDLRVMGKCILSYTSAVGVACNGIIFKEKYSVRKILFYKIFLADVFSAKNMGNREKGVSGDPRGVKMSCAAFLINA